MKKIKTIACSLVGGILFSQLYFYAFALYRGFLYLGRTGVSDVFVEFQVKLSEASEGNIVVDGIEYIPVEGVVNAFMAGIRKLFEFPPEIVDVSMFNMSFATFVLLYALCRILAVIITPANKTPKVTGISKYARVIINE